VYENAVSRSDALAQQHTVRSTAPAATAGEPDAGAQVA
jgi:hypothetical protein